MGCPWRSSRMICINRGGVTTISTLPQMKHVASRRQLRKYRSCLESAHDLSLYDVGGMDRHCTVRYGNIAIRTFAK
jgi:hypothetical protein